MTDFAYREPEALSPQIETALLPRSRRISDNRGRYAITVARSIEEIEAIRDIWQQLQGHLNADIDYYLTVNILREKVLRPHVMVLHDVGDPVAMLIGCIVEGPLQLRLGYRVLYAPTVRSLTICYGGALGVDSQAIARALMEEVVKTLARDEAEVADLNFLKIDSAMHRIAKNVPGFFSRDHLNAANRHYQLVLPDSFDAYLRTRSRNTRENIGRYSKRLVKKYGDRLSCIRYSDEKDIDRMLTDIEAVARKTYQRGLQKGLGDDERSRKLMSLAARRGWLRVHLLYIDGRPCAFWAGYLYQGTFFIDIPGYDPEYSADRVGHFLFMKIVEELCEDPEANVIDFGFGDAQYKRSFGTDWWEEGRVRIFASTPRGAVLNVTRTCVAKIEAAGRLLLKRTRLLNRVKSSWRNHIRQKNEGLREPAPKGVTGHHSI